MSFFAELRRRNVIRVAGLYVVSAWLLIQIAETLLPIFHTPDWVLQTLVVVLALGFVPTLVFSWVFELTPEGLQRESALNAAEPRRGEHTARRLDIAVIVLLIVAIGMIAWQKLAQEPASLAGEPVAMPATDATSSGNASTAPRSIAVLAFDDLSPNGDQAYFADGVSEELLNLLSRIDGFKVAARTSSFRFKGQQVDIAEIGRALNVETVLEGSVRKAGNQVRVTAQLIKVADGFHLWSASYDRELANIFAVQDEIAAAIVQALKLKLDLGSATAGRTQNTEAYDHYLRGRDLARAPTKSGLLRAVEQYELAVALDPDFAAAYAGIADAWVWLEDYGGVKSSESFPRAEQAAKRALQIDPESAEAHAAMAFVLDRYHNDPTAARAAFERTLQLNPNFVTAYNLYGDVLLDLGELDRMIEMHRKAVELDPLSVFLRSRLASKLITIRRLDEARVILDRIFVEFPDNDYAHEEMGNLEQAQGNLAESFRHYRVLHDARPGDPFAAAQLALVAVNFEDHRLAAAWADAARARGADNRWELIARLRIAMAAGDWDAIDALANLHAGYRGAQLRGAVAARRGQWPEARRHLLDAIDQATMKDGSLNLRLAAAPLIDLAWVEREQGLDGWRERLVAPRKELQSLIDAGAENLTAYDGANDQLARLEAVVSDREAALRALRAGERRGTNDPAFLQHDPVFAAWRDDPGFIALVADLRAHAAAERAKLDDVDLWP